MEADTSSARPRRGTLYWRRLRRNPLAIAGLAVFAFFLAMAAVGPWVAPYGHQEQNIAKRLQPPQRAHPFGTDQFGRDIFSRVLAGSRGIFLLGGTGTLLAALAEKDRVAHGRRQLAGQRLGAGRFGIEGHMGEEPDQNHADDDEAAGATQELTHGAPALVAQKAPGG